MRQATRLVQPSGAWGRATSLLFSTFESWLVGEHFKRGYEDTWLSEIFSKAVFLGNGLTAIASGLIGNMLVMLHRGRCD